MKHCRPMRLIGDAAYDSDGLDRMLADCGIDSITRRRLVTRYELSVATFAGVLFTSPAC
jgi:hypothetical protein